MVFEDEVYAYEGDIKTKIEVDHCIYVLCELNFCLYLKTLILAIGCFLMSVLPPIRGTSLSGTVMRACFV